MLRLRTAVLQSRGGGVCEGVCLCCNRALQAAAAHVYAQDEEHWLLCTALSGVPVLGCKGKWPSLTPTQTQHPPRHSILLAVQSCERRRNLVLFP